MSDANIWAQWSEALGKAHDRIAELEQQVESLELRLEAAMVEEALWEEVCLERSARIEELEQDLSKKIEATKEDMIRIIEIAVNADPGAVEYYLRRAGLIGESIGMSELERIVL